MRRVGLISAGATGRGLGRASPRGLSTFSIRRRSSSNVALLPGWFFLPFFPVVLAEGLHTVLIIYTHLIK